MSNVVALPAINSRHSTVQSDDFRAAPTSRERTPRTPDSAEVDFRREQFMLYELDQTLNREYSTFKQGFTGKQVYIPVNSAVAAPPRKAPPVRVPPLEKPSSIGSDGYASIQRNPVPPIGSAPAKRGRPSSGNEVAGERREPLAPHPPAAQQDTSPHYRGERKPNMQIETSNKLAYSTSAEPSTVAATVGSETPASMCSRSSSSGAVSTAPSTNSSSTKAPAPPSDPSSSVYQRPVRQNQTNATSGLTAARLAGVPAAGEMLCLPFLCQLGLHNPPTATTNWKGLWYLDQCMGGIVGMPNPDDVQDEEVLGAPIIEETEELAQAAVKIQSVFRGSQARKEVKEIDTERKEPTTVTESKGNSTSAYERKENTTVTESKGGNSTQSNADQATSVPKFGTELKHLHTLCGLGELPFVGLLKEAAKSEAKPQNTRGWGPLQTLPTAKLPYLDTLRKAAWYVPSTPYLSTLASLCSTTETPYIYATLKSAHTAEIAEEQAQVADEIQIDASDIPMLNPNIPHYSMVVLHEMSKFGQYDEPVPGLALLLECYDREKWADVMQGM